jgi:hypothetical protein
MASQNNTNQEKLDLFKRFKDEYAAKSAPALVQTRSATYLAVPGQGAPGGEEFTLAVSALYGMAFTIKMTRKFAGQQDYAVCKLEALWPEITGGCAASAADKNLWRWTLLIRTPEFIVQADLDQALAALRKRGKDAGAERVRRIVLDEGLCVQALHAGPYEDEGRTFAAMTEFAAARGYSPHDAPHEIYLNDPRRVAPAQLKTILRLPVCKAS